VKKNEAVVQEPVAVYLINSAVLGLRGPLLYVGPLRQIVAANGRENTRAHRAVPWGFEDAALLMERARCADDLRVPRGTLHAAIVRSSHVCAEILSIDPARALAKPRIECVVTGEDARSWTRPFTAAIKSPIEYWYLATDPVRYAGEPVAVIVASDLGPRTRRGHEEAGFETSVLRKGDFFVKFAHQMGARQAYAQRSYRIAATTKSLMLRV